MLTFSLKNDMFDFSCKLPFTFYILIYFFIRCIYGNYIIFDIEYYRWVHI